MADAAIYARYSSHNQREASITDQVRECTKAAERAGDRVVKVYREAAKSGTNTEHRPVFRQMIADSKKGHWSKVYVYKEDRFARNRADAATYKRKLKKWGVTVVSATEPVSDGPEGILMMGMLESYAEFYSAQLGVLVRRGLEGNALQCKHNGVQTYGYDLGEDGYYHVNEDEASVVRTIFKMVAAGSSLPEVVTAIEPFKTKRGKHFTVGRLSYLLKNEKYVGTYIYGDHRVEGGMEAIVSKELFERANSKLKGHRKKAAYDYVLSGKLFDKDGRRFVGTSARGKGGMYFYYRVQETGESYRREKVERAVYEAVSSFLQSEPGLKEAIAKAVVRIQDEALSDEHESAKAMRDRMQELDRKADNIVDMIADTGPNDRLAERLRDIEDERSYLAGELTEIERSAPKLTEEFMLGIMDSIIALEAPMSVVERFVERVVIDGKEMTIEFNVSEHPLQPDEAKGHKGCLRSYQLVGLVDPYTKWVSVTIAPYWFSLTVYWR